MVCWILMLRLNALGWCQSVPQPSGWLRPMMPELVSNFTWPSTTLVSVIQWEPSRKLRYCSVLDVLLNGGKCNVAILLPLFQLWLTKLWSWERKKPALSSLPGVLKALPRQFATNRNLAKCSYCASETTLASFNLCSRKPLLLAGELRMLSAACVQTTNMGTLSQMNTEMLERAPTPVWWARKVHHPWVLWYLQNNRLYSIWTLAEILCPQFSAILIICCCYAVQCHLCNWLLFGSQGGYYLV